MAETTTERWVQVAVPMDSISERCQQFEDEGYEVVSILPRFVGGLHFSLMGYLIVARVKVDG